VKTRLADGSVAAARVRAGLRRSSEGAEARIARGLGAPALVAIALTAVGSSIYFVLGVVAGYALGLTPVVFLLAGFFFVLTMLTYVEGSSLHPERGGASTFARYAFNELWSFIAGWAMLLDYLIVMAIGAFAVSHYLAAFWGVADDVLPRTAIAAAVIAFVAWSNVQGQSAERVGRVLRLSLLNVVLFGAIMIVGFGQLWHPHLILDSIHLGRAPAWDDLVFAAVVATVASTGLEAASGLAGDLRVGRSALRRMVIIGTVGVGVLFIGMSVLGLLALPVHGQGTALGGAYIEAPVLGIVSSLHSSAVMHFFRYGVGAMGALVLIQAVNGQMLGLARISYSLATNRQIPSLVGRLHARRSTPYVAILIGAALAFGLTLSANLKFLAGIFAFGAMLAFTLAHLSIVVLRFREPERPRAFRVPLSVRVRGVSLPLPAAAGALVSAAAWLSVLVLHEGARIVGGVWMLFGVTLYVAYRGTQDRPLTKRFTVPEEALREGPELEYGSILVPVFGEELDDDIVGTAGRLAAEEADDSEDGAVLEALYVFEMPMSLPIDARVPEERVKEAKRVLARAKEVGEEYEGVEVATAMVRGRSAGQAIVAEAKRRGVEAIVLAAEQPTRIRGGALLGGRGAARDRFVGETTRYVIEKAPCKVILTAAPTGEEGTREGVAP
jgi:basic amino acid/polyamine antiporter, APA family